MDTNEIVFFSPNKAENPWIENASCDTRHFFMTAVVSLLAYKDKDFNIKPLSLKSFHWDNKNKHYILTIKENLYFTNARKVTIEDLEFSILRHIFAATANEGTIQLINIKGAEKITPGEPFHSGKVEGVKILDQFSLAITPSSPNPNFMHLFTRWNYSFVPREELKDDLLNWRKWPIGVGAYKIKNEDKENRNYTLELVDSKTYPYAPQTILFDQERKTKPDLTLKDALSTKDSSFKKMELTALQNVRIFSFNYSAKQGSNSDFRKAINLSLQRKSISLLTLDPTQPLNELLAKGTVGRINIDENQNIVEANKLFKKSLGSQINEIFKIPYSPDLEYLGNEYRNELIKQFDAAGLKVEFVLSTNLWNPFVGELINSPFRLHSIVADFYDPLMSFAMYKNGSPLINCNPNDDKLEQLLDEAKKSSNKDALEQNIENLSNYFNENNFVVPLLEIPTIAYYNPQKINSIGEQFGGQTFHLANIILKG
ncbi:ABC transporter substrate-binding protein [Fluviispira multicolorata]|uniref:Solute-binding protein family 5 domain-containing protein n=1 Tax=Fluviispira multicolorata TaxID=2654512 RepID=A0A833JFA4_9BACT|nr:ABC transporter substrate-binding protein [Fluviispira multicolorata]KAB8033636.1 hypothetical protein GCL57_02705 [Fluviispira multicolorata]